MYNVVIVAAMGSSIAQVQSVNHRKQSIENYTDCKRTVYMVSECVPEQHVRRTLTLTLTHISTAYSVSGNVVRVRTLICVILYGFFSCD